MKAWKWLEDMYEKRHHWVKAYSRGTFFVGMKSSQRSESMNAFFDGFVHSTTPLNEFVDQYDKALADRRSKEETDDLFNMRTHLDLTYLSPIECHARKVYTRKFFNLVAEEFKHVWSCEHKKLRKEGDLTTYEDQRKTKSGYKISFWKGSGSNSITNSSTNL
ncbi:PREDICTED: protein FAR1-RELATED SEQUENCE 5-like [Lupinus angustifolius]|uniref:protein FAR1-RELATED SEQUENCE 5-like n=1 Tax=Lupinus angustifolius TaxID=3871 RepID=UPI00092FD60F|nr:PREDICTED: protein FAR1-RELATED SEQUENCE 5-like [Lupinus angustifolius]